ncbi:MAG: hypothetical protein ACYC5G_02585 [Candidatus Doudnabacteria bacterium]
MMENKQKILVGLVVLLAIALISMLLLKNNAKQNKQAEKPQINRTDAPKGEIVSGFPEALVIDSSAETQSSYTIKYETENQYTASFKTNKNVKDEYSAYMSFFENNKYEVVNKSEGAVVSSIYAKDASGEVNVVISRLEKDTQTSVVVSYLKK